MNIKPVIAIALSGMLLATGCQAPAKRTYRPSADLAPSHAGPAGLLSWHLAHEWLKAAEKLRLKDATVVYFQGTAENEAGQGEAWTGTIKGDILLLTADRAVVTVGGTLTVGRNESVRLAGPSSTYLAKEGETPAWSDLLDW